MTQYYVLLPAASAELAAQWIAAWGLADTARVITDADLVQPRSVAPPGWEVYPYPSGATLVAPPHLTRDAAVSLAIRLGISWWGDAGIEDEPVQRADGRWVIAILDYD